MAQSRCVECHELKDDPDEFSDGLRCTTCYWRGLEPEIGPTPPGVDSEGMLYDLGVHAAAEFGRKGNLVHTGRHTLHAMNCRLENFLVRQPDLDQRVIKQVIRDFAGRYR